MIKILTTTSSFDINYKYIYVSSKEEPKIYAPTPMRNYASVNWSGDKAYKQARYLVSHECLTTALNFKVICLIRYTMQDQI
jgi:hypothetical protein